MVLRFLSDRAYRRSRYYRIPLLKKPDTQKLAHYLVTATIVRNEARFMKEFVMFHQSVGVDHMVIYDDESEDNLFEILIPFMNSGFVSLIPWPRFIAERNNQFLAYQHAIASQRGKTHWLAMIDADEFLFAPNGGDLKNELSRRERFSAVGVYSHTFGTSGLDELQPGMMITRQLISAAPGDYIKNCTHRTIVQPHAVVAIRSANSCVLGGTGALAWDEDGFAIHGTGETGHGRTCLRINHYFSRAKNDFHRKISRGYFGKSEWHLKMQGKLDELCELESIAVPDQSIQPCVDRLAKFFD